MFSLYHFNEVLFFAVFSTGSGDTSTTGSGADSTTATTTGSGSANGAWNKLLNLLIGHNRIL